MYDISLNNNQKYKGKISEFIQYLAFFVKLQIQKENGYCNLFQHMLSLLVCFDTSGGPFNTIKVQVINDSALKTKSLIL